MSQPTGDFWSERRANFRQPQQPQQQQQQQQQQYPGPFENHIPEISTRPFQYGASSQQQQQQQRPYVHYQPRFVDQGRITVVPVNKPAVQQHANYHQNYQYPNSRFPLNPLPEAGVSIHTSGNYVSTSSEVVNAHPVERQISYKRDSSKDEADCEACNGTGRKHPFITNPSGNAVSKKSSSRDQRIALFKSMFTFLFISAIMVGFCFGIYYLWKVIGV